MVGASDVAAVGATCVAVEVMAILTVLKLHGFLYDTIGNLASSYFERARFGIFRVAQRNDEIRISRKNQVIAVFVPVRARDIGLGRIGHGRRMRVINPDDFEVAFARVGLDFHVLQAIHRIRRFLRIGRIDAMHFGNRGAVAVAMADEQTADFERLAFAPVRDYFLVIFLF